MSTEIDLEFAFDHRAVRRRRRAVTNRQTRGRIVVDLVPLRADGVNGGIKPLTLGILTALAQRGWDIACLCDERTQASLRARLPAAIALHALAPGQSIEALHAQLVGQQGRFDLSFFPMQAVSFFSPDCPSVSAIMDLQFADMPENFAPDDRAERERAFQSCINLSDRIVAISRFTADRIKALSTVPAGRIDTIPIALPSAGMPDPDRIAAILDPLGLRHGTYLLYPANFWPHKNHARLIEAFLQFRSSTGSDAILVLTGDRASPLGDDIADRARQQGGEALVLTGYVTAEAMDILTRSARALVFPSLYEGFGMPVIEAMQRGVPVAAAWTSSLPEVVNGAALLFDPHSADTMARAIGRVMTDETLRTRLVERGHLRATTAGTLATMTDRYEACFERALATPRRQGPVQVGIFSDAWMGRSATFATHGLAQPHELEIVFEVPAFFPRESVTVTATVDSASSTTTTAWRGSTYRLSQTFAAQGGVLALEAGDRFRRSELFGTNDMRDLSVRIHSAIVNHQSDPIDLLRQGWAPTEASPARSAVVVLSRVGRGQNSYHAACLVPTAATRNLALGCAEDGAALTLVVCPQGDEDPAPATLETRSATPEILFAGSIRAPDVLALRSEPVSSPATIAPMPRGHARSPRISVVVPSFNQGRFIGRTLASVLDQAHIHDVHVFDGGSTDETVDVLRGFGTAVAFDSRPDGGQAAAVNKGIGSAKGDIIAWINSDDTYEPDAFAAVADVFANCPEVGVVYGEGFHIDEQDNVIERYPTHDFSIPRLLETCFLCQPATFFRRELVERHGALRESLRYCMDYELWLRLATHGARFERVDAFLANTRFYLQTKTLGARPQAHFEAADMLLQCFGVRSKPWIDHFAHIVTQDFAKPAGGDGDLSFNRIRALARTFWQADAFAPEAGSEGGTDRQMRS